MFLYDNHRYKKHETYIFFYRELHRLPIVIEIIQDGLKNLHRRLLLRTRQLNMDIGVTIERDIWIWSLRVIAALTLKQLELIRT